MKGVSFAMQVLIVVIVILIVALVVLSIFGGGIGNIGTTLTQLFGGSSGTQTCTGTCIQATTCPTGQNMIITGGCPVGQICCVG